VGVSRHISLTTERPDILFSPSTKFYIIR